MSQTSLLVPPVPPAPYADCLVLVAGGEDLVDLARSALAAEARVIAGGPDLASALAAFGAAAPDVVVAGTDPSDGEGLAQLEGIKRLRPEAAIVLMSRTPTVAEAVRAMQLGAASYVAAGDGVELRRAVRDVCERTRAARGEGARSRGATRPAPARRELVGGSTSMRRVLAEIALVGPTRTTVLLTGETGTGKGRLAEALHEASPRRSGPFVAVNCAALAETILESELFGHERGAFSGAHSRREGRFKLADGGTIFLDEVGEIPPSIQVKLLRVLQERQFERVGGNDTVTVDVRIVAATNRDLREMVAERTFRPDLYYRLNVMTLQVPPLRARRDDVPALVEHILPRLARDLGLPAASVTPDALRFLAAHDWPGNVRELENVLERALVLAQGQPIDREALAEELAPVAPAPTPTWPAGAGTPLVPGASFAEIERHAIMATYEACGRSPRRTAEILGLSPRTVHYRLREYRGEPGRRLYRGDRPVA
jgi:DNA-binding NtrC family response regulator